PYPCLFDCIPLFVFKHPGFPTGCAYSPLRSHFGLSSVSCMSISDHSLAIQCLRVKKVNGHDRQGGKNGQCCRRSFLLYRFKILELILSQWIFLYFKVFFPPVQFRCIGGLYTQKQRKLSVRWTSEAVGHFGSLWCAVHLLKCTKRKSD
ncbi:hypothetical protein ANANG_G00088490, partial [Anguilla anguilla]